MIRDYRFGQMKIDGEEHRHAQRSTGHLGIEKRVSPPYGTGYSYVVLLPWHE